MRMKLVWKLIVVMAAILTIAIGLSGYANNLVCAHYSLESAKAFLRFNSESIIKGIGQLMMNRNSEGIEDLITEISRDSTVYGDVRLVSHVSGEVVASRFDAGGEKLTKEYWSCAVCHDREIVDELTPQISDAVIDPPDGNRSLLVIAPILNESGCRTAACHAHADDPEVLGFLSAEYSLERIDAMVADRRKLITRIVLASLALGIIALWIMFAQLLEKPISRLIAGTERIAANQLDFRFEQIHDDEIGLLEESFNTMTARVQAHRDELRSTMEYLEGIVENSADIIITVTPEGGIETFNRGAEQALGYDRVELIGQHIEVLFADPAERNIAIEQLKDTDNVKNYETRFLAKNGQVRNVLLTLSRLRDRDGNAIGTFGISKDVTREKELRRELVRSQKYAAIGQAVTGIQHAIKNMLNALKGGEYLVRNGMAHDNRERIEEGWAMVEEGIERIGGLSHSMLNYAKEWKLELQTVDLDKMLGNIRELNRQKGAEEGVILRFEPSHGWPSVRCDPKLIHMATTDLVVNAMDACTWKDYRSQDIPAVELRTYLEQKENVFVIEVRDNGCGMSEEIKRNIFTPFFSTKKTLGTGLGLALTDRIIRVHGGWVSVESEPDRGTTFRIHLPVDGPANTKEANDG